VSAESTVKILRVASQMFLDCGNRNIVKITFATDRKFSFYSSHFQHSYAGPSASPTTGSMSGMFVSWCSTLPPAIQLQSPPYPQIYVLLAACLSLGKERNYKEVAVLLV
jgi:hypothetical protein